MIEKFIVDCLNFCDIYFDRNFFGKMSQLPYIIRQSQSLYEEGGHECHTTTSGKREFPFTSFRSFFSYH